MSRIVERLVKFEEWENKFGERLSKQLNWGKEVVRCKDCICFRTDEKNITYCASMGVQMEPDDFCSYGEREGE